MKLIVLMGLPGFIAQRMSRKAALVLLLLIGCTAIPFDVTLAGFWSSEPKMPVLMEFAGKKYTQDELPVGQAQQFYDIAFSAWEKQQQALADAAIELYMQQLAAREKVEREEIEKRFFPDVPPTDEDIELFYNDNKERIPYPLEQVRTQITEYLTNNRRERRKQELIATLAHTEGFRAVMPEPVAPKTILKTEGFPYKGKPDARVTVVEFGDFLCAHCKTAAETLGDLQREYPDDLRVVFIEFPLSKASRRISLVAACAMEQGRYWDFHQAVFDQQARLEGDTVKEIAEAIGLDMEKLNACLDSDRPEWFVSRAEAEAKRLGLSATPMIFMNGQRIQPPNHEDSLRSMVEAVLKKK
ncbi:DsbA family protein [Spongorhabdus nitratireducens]